MIKSWHKYFIVVLWMVLQILYLGLIVFGVFSSDISYRFYDKYIVLALVLLSLLIQFYVIPYTPYTRVSTQPRYAPFSQNIRLGAILCASIALTSILLYSFAKPNIHYTSQYSHFVGSVPKIVEALDSIFKIQNTPIPEMYSLVRQSSNPAYIITDLQTDSAFQTIPAYQGGLVTADTHSGWQQNNNGIWVTEREQIETPNLIFSLKPEQTTQYSIQFEVEELDLGSDIQYKLWDQSNATTIVWRGSEQSLDCENDLESELYCLPGRRQIQSPTLTLQNDRSYYLEIELIGSYRRRKLKVGYVGGYAGITTPRLVEQPITRLATPTIEILSKSPSNISLQVTDWNTEKIVLALHRPYSKDWIIESEQGELSAEQGQLNLDTNVWIIQNPLGSETENPISITITHGWWGMLVTVSQLASLAFGVLCVVDVWCLHRKSKKQ